MLNKPIDGFIEDGKLENIERKDILRKNGLGSLPDKNIFHMKMDLEMNDKQKSNDTELNLNENNDNEFN